MNLRAETDPLWPVVARAKDGDLRAFEELYEKTRQQVYAVLFRLVGPSPDLEDLVQEAYVQLARGLRGFRGEAKTSTFVHRVCANVALMHLRRARRRPEELFAEPPDVEASSEPGPERAAQVKQAAGLLERALDQMDENRRVVLVYHDIMDLRPEEIAQAMGTPVNTVRSRLARARTELCDLVAAARKEGGHGTP